MRIKDPVLRSKNVVAIYEVDVEGTKVEVVYSYDMDNEGRGGWDYDLSDCYAGLTDEEIEDLEDEFESIIEDIGL